VIVVDRWQMYASGEAQVAGGWTMTTVTTPSRLGGSNGMTFGPDGRLYVTQVFGSQVTAIDVDSGAHEVFSPIGSGIVGPDDGFFGADGTFFATEPLYGRVTARAADGSYRVVGDDLPAANGVTMDHARRRLFVDEFRPGGRLMELDPTGAASPRILLEDLDGPNAAAMGPDGRLYFPQVFANEVWVYDLDDGVGRRAVDDLSVPTAVKFDSLGRLVVSEAGAGRITVVDLATGARTVLAEVPKGIDNVSVGVGDRIFVSHYVDGRVAEETGNAHRILSEPGLLGPCGVTPAGDGTLLVADALSVARVDRDGRIERLLTLLIELHTLAVGVAPFDDDLAVLAATGEVLRYRPGLSTPDVTAAGLADPVTILPDGPNTVIVTERGTGCVTRVARDGSTTRLATGVDGAAGLARTADGSMVITRGTVIDVLDHDGTHRATIDGFADAQGVAVIGGTALVADAGTRRLVAVDLASGRRHDAVVDAPIGQPVAGTVPAAFCAVTADGNDFVVGANGDGSIRRLSRST
jgi:sugar lactone lactonase YvrE